MSQDKTEVTLNAEQIKSLRSLINYSWEPEDESFDDHCVENGFEPGSHIFHDMMVLEIAIAGKTEYAGIEFSEVDNLNRFLSVKYGDDDIQFECPKCKVSHFRGDLTHDEVNDIFAGLGCSSEFCH